MPDKLELNTLRYVYCRSSAEREALLHLLPPNLRRKYQSKIVSSTRSDLFYRRQTFVETARLSSKSVILLFSPDTQAPGPFQLHIELETAFSHSTKNIQDFILEKSYRIEIGVSSSHYTFRLFLDDHLAYANTYEEAEIPF